MLHGPSRYRTGGSDGGFLLQICAVVQVGGADQRPPPGNRKHRDGPSCWCIQLMAWASGKRQPGSNSGGCP